MTGNPTQESASGRGASDLAKRYEALRVYAVQRCAPPRRDGLIVLVRQGIAAWMEAWSRLPASPAPPVQTERQRPSPLPHGASEELVRVLTIMTLSHIGEMHV